VTAEPIDIPPEAPGRRRAVVLFLPPEVEQIVDEIRHRWDPAMADRIDAHLTLIHDVQDHGALGATLTSAAAESEPFELTLTSTACWGPPKWGIYLAVDDHDGGVWALHEALAPIEDQRWLRGTFRPHVTLVHGRTVTEEVADAAWAALETYVADVRVRIDEVCIVESRPGRWHVVDRFVLGAGASVASQHG
jgi:2'-5' RNA ligase